MWLSAKPFLWKWVLFCERPKPNWRGLAQRVDFTKDTVTFSVGSAQCIFETLTLFGKATYNLTLVCSISLLTLFFFFFFLVAERELRSILKRVFVTAIVVTWVMFTFPLPSINPQHQLKATSCKGQYFPSPATNIKY